MSEEIKKYRCFSCGWMPEEEKDESEYDHCPNCLASVDDEEDEDGDTCGGIYEPVSIWVKPNGSWEIIQRCTWCGDMRTVARTPEDNPIKLMSIAARPLADPPFPIERMQEMTRMMGGQGDMRGYYRESGE